ncbi:MAG: membrane protein of unknown function [Nitrospira sp.]|nr:MAG: membrane protein of unknown function [Nitrospira sp.]
MLPISRIALHLTGWHVLIVYICLAVGVAIRVSRASENTEFLLVVSILVGVCLAYLVLGSILRRKHQKWGLYLVKENDGIRSFRGTPMLMLWLGHIWRAVVINLGVKGVAALLKTAYGSYLTPYTEFAIDSLAYISTLYLAFIWLLKYQYGAFKLVRADDPQLQIRRDADLPMLEPLGEVESQAVSDSVGSLRSLIGGVLGTVAVLSYIVMGLVQFAAIYAFFKDYWGWWFMPSVLAALFISYTPLLGAIAGVFAATKVWEWSITSSLLLFFFPLCIALVVSLLAGFGTLVSGLTKKRA